VSPNDFQHSDRRRPEGDPPAALPGIWRCPICGKALALGDADALAEHEKSHRIVDRDAVR
jgi:hypothetical protein